MTSFTPRERYIKLLQTPILNFCVGNAVFTLYVKTLRKNVKDVKDLPTYFVFIYLII